MSVLPFRRLAFAGAFRLLLVLLAFGACSQAIAATYFIRTDGGNTTQCTGQGDAPYPGSGSNQACAWQSLHYALPASGSPRIAGGDTVIVGAGSYMIGWGAPGASGGRCYSGGPYDCYLAPIPSGLRATAKTRILGRGYDSGCTAAPKLWGTNRVTTVLNLQGSSNVEVACLEVTDQSDCIEFHVDPAARCQRDVEPYGAWASIGITASNSANVWLHDLNVHGLANRGIMAGGLSNWTVEAVRIRSNGWSGWEGDIGSGSSNSGLMVFRRVVIAWNGCGERWQSPGVMHGCWAQQSGGYGDGLGTAQTGGQWTVEDSWIHHNTSDGLDLLYLDGATTTSVVVRRVYAAANAGNQIKTRGKADIQNAIIVGNCAYFSGRYNMVAGDSCRALGNALSVTESPGQVINIRHNTITGEGDCLILTGGGNAASQTLISNNILIGQPEFLTGGTELSCGQYTDGGSALLVFTGNLFWNIKQNQCPAGSICGQNPGLADLTLAVFDPTPLISSVVLSKAAQPDAISLDYYTQRRPVLTASDLGAIEIL